MVTAVKSRSVRLPEPGTGPRFLPRERLADLIDALGSDGRRVIGPTVEDGAIVYGEVGSVADLPAGWHDEQAPGRYRLARQDDAAVFGYASSPTSWKRYTFPPRVPIGQARRDGSSVAFEPIVPDARPIAFLGVRGCDLAALAVHDRVLAGGPFADEDYATRRAGALVVAVQCTRPAATCFCTSMGTGPEVRSGADLVLTELDDGFVVAAGTPAGEALLARLPVRAATAAEGETGTRAVEAARATIGNPVDVGGLHDRLLDQLDSPRWAEVAERCLACTNCTLVCPTCFCTSVSQRSDLAGTTSTSERTWDSCFSEGFAAVAGGTFRARRQDRYRQWLTHKFATWIDQFGTFGCVGCGRCVTWCPVGIDVREELAAIAVPRAEPEPVVVAPPTAATPGQFAVATVRDAHRETADTVTLVLGGVPNAIRAGLPGQFVMVTRPGFPPLPISISRYLPDGIVLTIRAAGAATDELARLRPGDELGLRGPLGRPWPVEVAEGRDLVIVAGGIGLAPVRPIVDAVLADRARFGAVRLYYGARTPEDRLYVAELEGLRGSADLELGEIVDRAGEGWSGRVGIVTQLFDHAAWDGRRAVGFVCGPERMMQATAYALAGRGLAAERTFVSLERHMECGIGLCGHCQMGRWFVCRDGPVFSLAELGDAFGREGI